MKHISTALNTESMVPIQMFFSVFSRRGLFYESSYYIYVFMGVFLQAVPFLILGVLLSSALQTYVSEKWIVKLREM